MSEIIHEQRRLPQYPAKSTPNYLTTKVQVSDRNILEKLYLSYRSHTSHNIWSLVKELECDVRDLRDRLNHLLSINEIEMQNEGSIDKSTLLLTEIGRAKVEASGLTRENELILDSIKIRDAVTSFLERVPLPMPALAQYFFLPDTVRCLYMKMIQDDAVENKSVICLGTPTVGLGISITHRAKKVTVLDIDDELLDAMVREAIKWKAEPEVISHDLRLSLPSKIRRKYDTFVMDPVYTSAAYELFLSRGIQALRSVPRGIGYFPLPKYMKNDGRLFDSVLGMVDDMQLERSIIDRFVETDVPPFERAVLRRENFASVQPWRVASLVMVRMTASTHPLVKGKAKKRIYPSKLTWAKLPSSVASRTTAHKQKNDLMLNTPQNINYIFNEVAWFILLYIDKDIKNICSEIEKNFLVRKEHNIERDVKLFLEKVNRDGTIKAPIPIGLLRSLGFRIRKKKYTKPLMQKISSLSVLGGRS